jgi:DNA-binding LacI/PurR family transcriptional regulator
VDGAARTRITLRELAASLGVSKTTVSNAFSRPDQLSPELRDRILAAARDAGYGGPDAVARMLRTRRAGAIGLLLPDRLPFMLDDAAAGELLRGIADACEERRLGLLIVPGITHAGDTRAITGVAVDGFVAYSLPAGAGGLEAALGRDLPLVIVDQPRVPGITTVGIDDVAGARAVARHLVELGHRRLAIVSQPILPDGYTGPADAARLASPLLSVTADRLRGYREAIAGAGIDPSTVPVFECAHASEALGETAAAQLLATAPGDRPTAILAMTDRLALGALAAARSLGLRVPADLSIGGFDDIPAAAAARPPLTTVSQPHRLKGYAAARLLLDGLLGPETPTPATAAAAGEDRLDLPIELVVRRSTAEPPAGARSRPSR